MRSEENLSAPSKSSFNMLGWVAFFVGVFALAISIFNFYCIKNSKTSLHVLSNKIQQETVALQVVQQKINALQKATNIPTQGIFQKALDVHTQKTFSDISTLGQRIQQLSSIPEKPFLVEKNQTETNRMSHQQLNWHQQIFEKLKSLKNLFVIRHVDQVNTPVVAIAQEVMLKQNILMQLNIAQWALLRHNSIVYQTALNTVSRWILQYFLASDERKTILDQLTILITIPITASPSAKTPIELNTPTPKPSNKKSDNMPAGVET